MRFFAVGTTLDEEHLRNWIPSPRRLSIASLSGFTLRWHKRSSEGGKLAPLRTGHQDDVVWGVVYEVDGLTWQQYDEGQRGAAYREERATVVGSDGPEHDASVYVPGTRGSTTRSCQCRRIETRSSRRHGPTGFPPNRSRNSPERRSQTRRKRPPLCVLSSSIIPNAGAKGHLRIRAT